MTPQSGVNQEQIDAGMCDNLIDDYMRQIEVNGAFVAEALSLICDPANLPVVVHCTAGKDRTGIVIAMLLDLLGVERASIVADYHVTTKNMAPVVERIRNAPVFKENGLAYAPDWIFASDPETMHAFHERMTQAYGGAEQWARQHGVTAEQVAQLRASLLE
jgi:protein tyrosine/serine phosphatase